jgi:hypothetical protein
VGKKKKYTLDEDGFVGETIGSKYGSKSYCGGAIGVVAESFEAAVKIIVANDIIKAKQEAKQSGEGAPDYRRYYPKYFSKDGAGFKKDNDDQWLLTHELDLAGSPPPAILFDNWNYA